MGIPRMRVAKEIVEEIKQIDSKTSLTVGAVRRLVRENKLKYVHVGKKILINLDYCIDFLNNQIDSEVTLMPSSNKKIQEISNNRIEEFKRNIGFPTNGK